MRSRSPLVILAALLTLGSGLVNLFSLIGPSLPHRIEVLQDIFSLQFIHLSRFFTLVIGFALVVLAINIYKRKRRAFYIVLVLACLSIIFHLTKGLDYEEASASAVMLIALIIAHKHFTVRSSIPNLPLGLFRFGLAFIIVIIYGTAGFWFVEHHDFHVTFTAAESISETLKYLVLVGDPSLVPHTHYARWFLNSLYVITIVAIVYAFYSLFRPVIYRFRIHPRECDLAKQLVEKYDHSSLGYFKYSEDKSFLFSPSRSNVVAYRVSANYAVALGDPVAPAREMEGAIRQFREFCRHNDWGVGFYGTISDFLPVYEELGFRKLKVGDEAIVDVTQFNLTGKQNKTLRYSFHKLAESGLKFVHHDPPIPDEVYSKIKQVSDEWLQIPGRRERRFSLGTFEEQYVRSTPEFTVEDSSGAILAFANLIPSYHEGETTVDLMRRRIEAPNGVMDYLFIKLFSYLKEQGYKRFSLGLAPMAGFREDEEASVEEKAIHYFFQHLNFLFSFRGLMQYKSKFATMWESRYVIYETPLDLARLGIALREVSEIKD
jgi:phosphatidylglycerol lysyltransferase